MAKYICITDGTTSLEVYVNCEDIASIIETRVEGVINSEIILKSGKEIKVCEEAVAIYEAMRQADENISDAVSC